MNRQINENQPVLFPYKDLIPDDTHTGNACITECDHTELFMRLSLSSFRNSFHLTPKDRRYITEKGLDTIRLHAADFIAKRLAPDTIPNDGRQTPMRGHPVFRAQHATGCCCRSCLNKWHHIPQGRALTHEEQQYAVSVVMKWIEMEIGL